MLLAPPNWKGGAIGKRILVAWKPKREAARAVADAAPFFAHAEQVTVATVDSAKVTAEFDKGVLKLMLPMPVGEQAKTQKIASQPTS